MQDADVPIWDKGDRTDDYVKSGGSSFSLFDTEEKGGKVVDIEEIYELVLGRKPTSRELSYYRYSVSKKEDILKKLIKSEEHKEIVKKGREYPALEERARMDQSTILKLRHNIEDQQEEFNEMKSMLNEKNKEIDVLREEKRIPYVTQSFLEGKGTVYYGGTDSENSKPEKKTSDSWIDRLFYFIQKLTK